MSIKVLTPLIAVCFFASALSGQAIWQGLTNTDWNTASNWNTNTVPTAATNVVISSTGLAATLSANATCLDLTIEPGATLNGGAGTLNIEGSWTNNGTFNAGTSIVNFLNGGTNVTVGGTVITTFYRLFIQKNARTVQVNQTAPIIVSFVGTSTATPAFDIRQGTFRNMGFDLTVANGITSGTAPSLGELHISGGVCTFSSIYQFSTLKQFTVSGGMVTITGQIDIVNSSQRMDVTGGQVHFTRAGLVNVRLATNNLGWGMFASGGEVFFHGGFTTSISCNCVFSGSAVAHFVGTQNATLEVINFSSNSSNIFTFPDIRIAKTGGSKLTMTTVGTAANTSNVTLGALQVGPGAGIELAGNFSTGIGYRVTSISNAGTVTYNQNDIQVTGGITTLAGGTMTGNLGSAVKLTGAAASTLTGNNGFYNLVCTQAGRLINFEAGSTTTISGLLTLIGTAASKIQLRSTTPATVYNFNNQGAFVRHVDVRDCVASTQIVNAPGGVDSGNNTNWNFGGGLAVLAIEGPPVSVNANDKGPGNGGRQAGAFDIDNATAGALTLTGISLTAGGTANDSTVYTEVALYVDNIAGGTAGAFDATDVLFGTAVASFPANDGTVVFTDTLTVNAAQTRRIFAVVKLDGPAPAAAGQTLLTRISAMTSQSGSIAGTPSNFSTGLLIAAPNLTITYPTNPANTGKQVPPTYTGPGGNGFELTRFAAVVTGSAPVNLTSMTLTNIGSATTTPAASTMYTRFELYKDTNGNQVWDPADVRIGNNTPVLAAIFTFPVAEQTHAGGSTTMYFVIGGLNSPNLAANGITFNFYISAMTVTSPYPGATFGGTGQVRNGATVNTSATSALLYLYSADTAAVTATQTDTGPGGNGFQAGKFNVDNLSATTVGVVNSFTVTINSSLATFIPRVYTELKFFQDTNNSGAWDAGDTQVGGTVSTAVLGTLPVTTAILPTFTAAAPINFAANSSTSFFLVVKFNGTPLPSQGETYRSFISSVAVGAATLSSGVSTANAGGAFIVPNQLAVVATAGAPLDVYSNDQGTGDLGIEAGKFSITANNTPGSDLLSISIQASGSGDDSNAFLEVAVYRDGAAGTVGSYDNANDTLIGTAATFPGNDGTLLFNVPVPEQSFAASEARDYFVVVRLANTATPGQTFQFRVVDIGVNLGKGGVPSAIMAGLTIKAPAFTIVDNSLPQATAFAGQGGFVIQQFTVSYPAGPDNTLTDLTFTGVSATGNVQGDITPVELYRDDNANGVYDAGTDVLVHSVVNFGIGNQVQFTLPAAESLFSASATARQYFVVVGFVVTTPNQSIFQTQLMGATGASQGTIINGTPAPAGGAAPGLEVLANNLLLTLNGPQTALTVGNLDQGPGDIGLVLWDGTIATISGAWTVNDITFTATGTANQLTAYSYVALWEDINNNGAYDGAVGGDALADPGPVGGFAGGTFTATLTNQAFPAQTARRFFVVVKLAGTATTGQTLNAELSSLNGTPPAGGQFTGDINVSSTALIIDVPSVSAFGAPGAPAVQTLKAGTVQTALVGKIRLAASNNDVDVTGLVLTGTGTGDWATDITTVEVWRDNGDGTFAAATDTMVFTGASGLTVNATFTAAVTVLNNDHRDLWLRVICADTAAVGASVPLTYTLGIASAGDIITTATPLLGAPAAQSSVLKIVDFFVNEFTPVADLLVGGRDIVIKGSGFEAPFQVRIGGTICPGTPVITATEVTGLTVPSGSGTALPIEIDSGTLATQTLTQTFNYVIVTKPKTGSDGCAAGVTAPWLGLAAPAMLAILSLRRRRK